MWVRMFTSLLQVQTVPERTRRPLALCPIRHSRALVSHRVRTNENITILSAAMMGGVHTAGFCISSTVFFLLLSRRAPAAFVIPMHRIVIEPQRITFPALIYQPLVSPHSCISVCGWFPSWLHRQRSAVCRVPQLANQTLHQSASRWPSTFNFPRTEADDRAYRPSSIKVKSGACL